MYFIDFDIKVISRLDLVSIDSLRCHEEVICSKKESLVNYFLEVFSNLIVPSVIVCDKTNTIIDGHHRYSALKELNKKYVPVTFVDYSSPVIRPYFDDRISKFEILNASNTGILLPPKSSKHIIFNSKENKWVPINLLSSFYYYE